MFGLFFLLLLLFLLYNICKPFRDSSPRLSLFFFGALNLLCEWGKFIRCASVRLFRFELYPHTHTNTWLTYRQTDRLTDWRTELGRAGQDGAGETLWTDEALLCYLASNAFWVAPSIALCFHTITKGNSSRSSTLPPLPLLLLRLLDRLPSHFALLVFFLFIYLYTVNVWNTLTHSHTHTDASCMAYVMWYVTAGYKLKSSQGNALRHTGHGHCQLKSGRIYTERERGRERGIVGAFDMLQEIEIIDSNAESVGKKRAAQVSGEWWRVGGEEMESWRESGQTEPNWTGKHRRQLAVGQTINHNQISGGTASRLVAQSQRNVNNNAR